METATTHTAATLPPLFANCKHCQTRPIVRTRQRAIGARPATEWRGACEKHIPGSALAKLPPDHPVRLTAERGQFHETQPLGVARS
jgi:hypothetical protein